MNSFSNTLSIQEITLRVFMAIIIGGVIGYERGHQNRPAGFRTHILVCLGAAIVSMVQDQLRIDLFNFSVEHPGVSTVLKTDLGRIGAQVVSGIGFLGAGTIMRDKGGIVAGLTTAASIWTTGCLGLGIGWGFYNLAIISVIAVIVVLVILKKFEKVVIEKKHIVKIEIRFKDDVNFSEGMLETYSIIKNMSVQLQKVDKNFDNKTIVYTMIFLKQVNPMDILAELSSCNYVQNSQFN